MGGGGFSGAWMAYEDENYEGFAEEGNYEPPMSDEKLGSIVSAELEDAISFADEVGEERASASRYYKGEPFGNEAEGRSQVVSTDVRDVVQGIMPSLMRVFFSSEKVVEFVPQGPEDVASAEQATDYVNWIVREDNPGFTIFHAAFKDALVRRTGVIKWYSDERVNVSTESFSGLDDDALQLLMETPDVEVVEIVSRPDPGAQPGIDPMTGMNLPTPQIHDVTIKRVNREKRVRLEAVPPEEFLFDRRARNVEDASLIAHRRSMRISDLVAMGYDLEEVRRHAGDDSLESNSEVLARNSSWLSGLGGADSNDAVNRVLYVEAYLRVDFDGDGIDELRKICTMGPGYEVVMNEPVDEAPFAVFCPDPEPHTLLGLSVADRTMDLQKIKSMIMRATLDSLALSIQPRMVVVEGQASMEDVLNDEVGAIIRARQPGMVQPLEVPFVGAQGLSMLAYLDNVREDRTGMSKAAQGLDADALQSTTRAAVQATISAAQQQLELICRVFAEQGMKPLFRGILRTIIKHQDKPKMIRLRNQFVPMDPRSWNSSMDVAVSVGLGSGSVEERMTFLGAVATKQETVLRELGVENPLTSLQQLRNTYAKMVELAGYADASFFFKNPEMEPPVEAPPPPPDPAIILAQVEQQKTAANIQEAVGRLALERQKMLLEDDRARDKQEADAMLRAYELQLKYGQQIDTEAIMAAMQRQRTVNENLPIQDGEIPPQPIVPGINEMPMPPIEPLDLQSIPAAAPMPEPLPPEAQMGPEPL